MPFFVPFAALFVVVSEWRQSRNPLRLKAVRDLLFLFVEKFQFAGVCMEAARACHDEAGGKRDPLTPSRKPPIIMRLQAVRQAATPIVVTL
jgi:hypothetical protein